MTLLFNNRHHLCASFKEVCGCVIVSVFRRWPLRVYNTRELVLHYQIYDHVALEWCFPLIIAITCMLASRKYVGVIVSVFQRRPIGFITHGKLCCITKSTMMHQQKLDSRLDLLRFSYGRFFTWLCRSSQLWSSLSMEYLIKIWRHSHVSFRHGICSLIFT